MLKSSDRHTVDHQGGLTIHAVSRASDAGVYTCTARDRQGHTARRDVTLDVVGKLHQAIVSLNLLLSLSLSLFFKLFNNLASHNNDTIF